MVGVIGLHDHLPGSSRDRRVRNLGEELEDALRGTKIRQPQRVIAAYNANQGYRGCRDLGNHLRADEQVDFAGVEARRRRSMSPRPRPCAIHAAERAGKDLLQSLLPCCDPAPRSINTSLSQAGQSSARSFCTAVVTF